MNKGLSRTEKKRERELKLIQLIREANAGGKPVPHHLLKASQLENIVDIDGIISPLIEKYSPIIRNELERLAGEDSAGDTKHSIRSLRKEDCRIKCKKCDDGWVDVSENLEQKMDESHVSIINMLKESGTIELGALAPTALQIERDEYSCLKCGQPIDNIGMEIGRSERLHRISNVTIRSILLTVLGTPIVKGNERFWLVNQKNNRKVGIKLPKSNRCLWMNDRDKATQSVTCPQCKSPVGSSCKSKAGKNIVTHKKRVYQYYETEEIEEPCSDEGDTLEEIMALQYNDKIQRTIVEDLLTLASENNSTINIDNEEWVVGSSSSQKKGGSFRALGLNLMYNLAKEINGLVSDEKRKEKGGEFDTWCERMAGEIIYAIDGANLSLIELKSPRYMLEKDSLKKGQRTSSSTMIQTCVEFTQEIIKTIPEKELERIRNEISSDSLRPMIVPPQPWSKDGDEYVGGYKEYNAPLITNAHQMSVTKHPQFEPSERCLDALNDLQETRWGINNEVVKIVKDVLNNRISQDVNTLLELTLEDNKFVATLTDFDYSYLSFESVREWKRDIACANDDVGKQLYHVYNLDYRGRVYTTAHRLNPQGDDVSRSMLTFSDSVKLNERGWYWIRVHTVAIWQGRCSGQYEWIPEKGMTLDEMAEWAKRPDFIEAMGEIVDNPIDNLHLWADEDIFTKKCEGFQRISITKEFYDIIKETSGRGVGGTSHLPIRQDASSNIYQHQALLLLDKGMADKVNVIPKEDKIKSDVYQLIANNVELDFNEGPLSELTTEQQNEIRKFTKKRSTAKGPVMTVGYGAKTPGIKESFLTHNGESKDGGGRVLEVWIQNEGEWELVECAHYKSKLAIILSNVPINKHSKIAMKIAQEYVAAIKLVLPNYNMVEKRMKGIYNAMTTDDNDYENKNMTKEVLKNKLERRGLSTSFGKDEMIELVEKYAEKEWLKQNDISSMNGNNLEEKLKELNQPTSDTRPWLIECLIADDEDSDADTQQSDNELYAKWMLPDGSRVTLVSLKRSDSDPIPRSDYLRNKGKDQDIIQQHVNKLNDSCEKLSNEKLIDDEGNILWDNIRNPLGLEIDDDNCHGSLNKEELNKIRDTEENGDKMVRILANIANKSSPPSISIRRQNRERNKKGERRATPPGFIHSYDACHLRGIALHMKQKAEENERPFQFWGVHDSFGVGANDVDEMRGAIINELVKLYTTNPFNRFPNNQKIRDWVNLNPIGTLDISEVAKVDDEGYPLSEWFVGP